MSVLLCYGLFFIGQYSPRRTNRASCTERALGLSFIRGLGPASNRNMAYCDLGTLYPEQAGRGG